MNAKTRTELGKKANALRRAGLLPAVVYGEGTESINLSILARDFEKTYNVAGETGVIGLNINGERQLNVMIHDVANDILTGKPIHVDFYSVRMDKEIEAKVPIVFSGEPPAVKNEGGIFVKVMHEVEVRALPSNLPREISIDIAGLKKIGDKIHMKDAVPPAGVTLRQELNEVVALIEAPRTEELVSVAPSATEVAEVKTEQEIKAEERTAKSAAKAEAEKT